MTPEQFMLLLQCSRSDMDPNEILDGLGGHAG